MTSDFVVVGGGVAGVCCAVTAARAGIRVTMVQDRPILGGNASSEVRLWILGATSHMGNNNRWAREGGVIDEILVENTYRNPEGNPIILDMLLLEKVRDEPNIELLLNTAVFEVAKSDPDTIATVRAFCSQNSTMYEIAAPLFCDASGDGIVGFLSGAAFRMGAETPEEFGERFAPAREYGALLGDSIYFYSKDAGRPVRFTPPSFALKDISRIPQYRRFNTREHGCQLWWIEYGGHLDTVHDSERIKWELWKIVYGVWNYIKNSGSFPEAETLTLEWVGMIPGKRESRRFEGDYMLIQQDIIEQRQHTDAVSYGGWSIDLHPAEGVYGDGPACDQWHSKGVYQIPYRCMYSRNIGNLFLAGRLMSASHVAFGSSRVMATCAHNGQAVGMAAAQCIAERCLPRDLLEPPRMLALQRDLIRIGQYIPGLSIEDEHDLARTAAIHASSSLRLGHLAPSRESVVLDAGRAMLLPIEAGPMPAISLVLEAAEPTQVQVELRVCSRLGSFTPDVILETVQVAVPDCRAAQRLTPARTQLVATQGMRGSNAQPLDGKRSTWPASHDFPGVHGGGVPVCAGTAAGGGADKVREPLRPGENWTTIEFESTIEQDQYVFVCLMANPAVRVQVSDQRVTGVLCLTNRFNNAVARSSHQAPPAGSGIDEFEFWLPERRPRGKNLALRMSPVLRGFEADNVVNGPARPTIRPNAWVASPSDLRPALTLTWTTPQTIQQVELSFDTDFDHPQESVLMGHPENAMPFCVKHYRLIDQDDHVIWEIRDNHQTRNVIRFPDPVRLSRLQIEVLETHGAPAAIFSVRCYAPQNRDEAECQ